MPELSKIRNVALVGQVGTGKTTLAEALLMECGVVNRMGTVEDGNTVTDFLEEEHDRGQSTNVAYVPMQYRDLDITLADCPGSMEFHNEGRAAVRGCDIVVGVVGAGDGLEVGTEKPLVWAGEANCARAVFVNKMDMDRADFDAVVQDLKDTFSGITPLQLPIGSGENFTGIIDLLRMKAYVREDGDFKEVDIPDDHKDAADDAHNVLVENVAVSDEDLMNRYLEEGELPFDVLSDALRQAVANMEVIPVCLGTAKSNKGSKALLRVLVDFCPGPHRMAEPTGTKGGDEVAVKHDPNGSPVALVIKTVVDQFLGQLSVIRVQSGTFKPDMVLVNSTKDNKIKAGPVYVVNGKEYKQVDSLHAGQIGAIGKLDDVSTGDTLAAESDPIVLPTIEWPTPVFSYAIFPKTKNDETRLSTGLQKLALEDPLFHWERIAETHETVASGMGQIHVETMLLRLEKALQHASRHRDTADRL